MKRSGYALIGAAVKPAVLGFVFAASSWSPGVSADMTVREIAGLLFRAEAGAPIDFSRKDLAGLDLSGLDFKKATLARADLFGVNLTGADLSRADLKGARLDRAIILSSRFDGADLSDASVLRPSAFSTLTARPGEAPSFAAANLARAQLFGRFNHANFRGADLSGANLAPFQASGFFEQIWRTEFMSADLAAANFTGADARYVFFAFADLRGANFAGADVRRADFSRAQLDGADFSGANVAEADFDGATLTGSRGLDTAAGLASAKNMDKAAR